jgi:hypothetical protein
MVTATLTAAALNAQITSQRQRVLALETTLKTMESGMDKHMVQASSGAGPGGGGHPGAVGAGIGN